MFETSHEIATLLRGTPTDEPQALLAYRAADRLDYLEQALLGSQRLMWAAIRAAGGSVVIPDELMVDAPNGFLHMHKNPSIPGRVINADWTASDEGEAG